MITLVEQIKRVKAVDLFTENGLHDYYDQINLLKYNYLDKGIHNPHGMYPFIAISPVAFQYLLANAKKKFIEIHKRDAKTFIDLGCGVGNTMYLAGHLGLSVTGVEINSSYIEIGKQLLANGNFIEADLLKWIPTEDYDIIYFYKPLAYQQLWHEFIKHFMSYVKIGQVIISPMDFGETMTDLGYSNTITDSNNVYVVE